MPETNTLSPDFTVAPGFCGGTGISNCICSKVQRKIRKISRSDRKLFLDRTGIVTFTCDSDSGSACVYIAAVGNCKVGICVNCHCRFHSDYRFLFCAIVDKGISRKRSCEFAEVSLGDLKGFRNGTGIVAFACNNGFGSADINVVSVGNGEVSTGSQLFTPDFTVTSGFFSVPS